MECYTCPRELLPVIEAALAAEGFVIEEPLRRASGTMRITVMTRGSAVISLYEDSAHDLGNIHVYRSGEASQLMALRALPRLLPEQPRARRAPLPGTRR